MPKYVLIDELQISVTGSEKLPADKVDTLRQTLFSRRFKNELTQAVKAVFKRHPTLKPLKVRVAR